jgi:hypothetical protein
MPRSLRIVDGNESSYGYTKEAEFAASYSELKKAGRLFADSRNQTRFDRCWQVGQAIYLDLYCDPVRVAKYNALHGGTAVEELEANTASAFRASDEYV